MSNPVFIKFTALTFSAGKEAVERYEQAIAHYNDFKEEWDEASEIERMRLERPKKPKKLNYKNVYKDFFVNLTENKIKSFIPSFDEDEQFQIVIVDFIDSTGEEFTINVKATIDEFYALMMKVESVFVNR